MQYDAGLGRRRVPRAPAAFIDKDGTLVEDVPFNVDPDKLRFTAGAVEGLRLLCEAGYRLIVISNQSGIALGRFDAEALTRLAIALRARLAAHGIELHAFHACPHAPGPFGRPACACRKPEPGLLQEAARRHRIDLTRSWMIGDILDDVQAGHAAGCRTVLLDVGHETQWVPGPLRSPDLVEPDLEAAARAILLSDAPDTRRAA